MAKNYKLLAFVLFVIIVVIGNDFAMGQDATLVKVKKGPSFLPNILPGKSIFDTMTIEVNKQEDTLLSFTLFFRRMPPYSK